MNEKGMCVKKPLVERLGGGPCRGRAGQLFRAARAREVISSTVPRPEILR